MFRIRPRSAAAVLVLSSLAGWMLSGCSGAPPAPETTVSVEGATVQVRPISLIVSAEGVLFPVQQASLTPKITAPVRQFYVNRGDRVHRGELLAVLDNRDLAASMTAAKGHYDQAKANYISSVSSALPEAIQTATLNVGNTEAALAAQQKLYASESKLYLQGAIARKQLDATKVTLTAAQSAYQSAVKRLQSLKKSGESAELQAAKGQLEAARGQYLNASAQLAYSRILSPIDGVIAERTVFPGDIAPAGRPLIVVMNTSEVVARLHIPQQQAAELKLGNVSSISEPGLSQSIPGKVTVISPALDPGSTTVEVWVQAKNPNAELRPGASVTVSITARTFPKALVIPSSAILTSSDGAKSVMVVTAKSVAQSQVVSTGIEQGERVQILSGLHPGEEVIVHGAYGLPDGTRVKVAPAKPLPDELPSANLPSADSGLGS